ncbi:MAG: restriction endonuclease subunit S [Bacteroidales bacterium]|nr:restriction endonuclease subunit S [Bacteroidales bacterium]
MRKVKLKDVAEIKGGFAFKSKEFVRHGVPILRISDITNEIVTFSENSAYMPIETISKCQNYIVEENDVVIALSGATTGKFGIYKDKNPCLLNQRVAIIKSGKSNTLDQKYFYYYLTVLKSEILRKASGAAQPNISTNDIGELQIPLPSLPEQKHIAEVLDKADALRQKNKELLQEYNDLQQAIFLDMFGDPVTNPKGWEKKKLESLCGVGSSKRVFVEELVDSGIPFYRGTEIGQMSDMDEIKPSLFITQEHYENLKEHTGIPKIGDLLMPSICSDGRIYRVTNENPFYFKDGRVLWVKVNNQKINGVFLQAYLKAVFLVNYSKIASGTTFAELKIVSLKKIQILNPPIDLQTKFASIIENIEQQKEKAKESLAYSEELFGALVQRYFGNGN